MQDGLTKFSLGVAIANTVAETLVLNFMYIHGIPETILTDQGTDFLSKTFTFKKKRIRLIRTLEK